MNRKTCIGCKYNRTFSATAGWKKTYHYILDTGEPRGCPADACTRYEKSAGKRKPKPLRLK